MTRGFCLSLIGSAVLVALAGCGRSFFQVEEREAWRHEAEVQCLKSGSVKESPVLVRVSPIEGPGICGADFPLKVVALGESPVLAFAGDLRPPGAIPNVSPAAQPRWPAAQPRYAPAPQSYPAPPAPQSYPAPPAPQYNAPAYNAPPQSYPPPPPPSGAVPGQPLSLMPPGIADPNQANAMGQPAAAPPPSYPPDRAAYPAYNAPPSYPPDRPAYAPPAAPVPLGPARGQITGSVGPVEVKPTATLACPIVSALDQWIAEAVQPAALRWFGQPVIEIKQISAYSCRGMNGQRGAKISEHAFGNALDIASFTLADGRKVVVRTAWNGLPEEQGFLRDVQGAACQQFSTVLAPGSNRFHYDHIHVDLMRRKSGRLICQPAAVPGEVAAARAAQRYAGKGDPAITGSIDGQQKPDAGSSLEDDDHSWMLDRETSSDD
ncbi:MAG: extensin family protein [Xanthobacteraceae bacterium]